ncbi:MAG: hypothetical protein ACYC09_10990 [Bacteroidota bacterium]
MITLDESKEEPVMSTGSFVLKLDRDYPPELWEFIHEAIADRLAHMNLKGSIECSDTGISITIQKQTTGKL